MTQSLGIEKVSDVFKNARNLAKTIEPRLRGLPESSGGWPDDKWCERSGGTLLIIDADEVLVSMCSVGGPNHKWSVQTERFAKEKARRALATGQNSIVTRNPADEQYAGAVLFQYMCAISGLMRTGVISYSGWFEWADHLYTGNLVESSKHLQIDYDLAIEQLNVPFIATPFELVTDVFENQSKAA